MNVPSPASEIPAHCYDPHPRSPRMRLPSGACDTHVHVIGPQSRYPFVDERPFTPTDAPKDTLFALHRALGFDRCVIVQSGIHGFDNSAVEDAIRSANGNYLGVALVKPEVSETELERLALAGFRAVRFTFSTKQIAAPVADVVALSARLAKHGMHLQVQVDSCLLSQLGPVLKKSAVTVVIDHMGRVPAVSGPDHEDMRTLRALLKNDLFYVKVSGIDRITAGGDYRDGIVIARTLTDQFADRCIWGSDWPHLGNDHIPDDAGLVEALEEIAPVASDRELILVSNPARLFRFEDR
ncbi:amidohydrolase family protein [Paraburkholderia sp. MM5477-R1]|uniref:amidohydrolase family protein n=1 Tax=Paraburkholderia sp. MM5477-R1 TaxID=2991062 RepID=UPI003D260897